MALKADGKIIIDTSVDTKGVKTGINEVSSLLSGAMGKLGGIIAKAGAFGAAAAGVKALAGSIKACVGESSLLEASIAKASTLFGTANVDTAKLADRIRDLSSDTRVAAEELGESLYNALSAGIPATDDMSEALALLESSAKLSKAGFTDIDTAMTATAKTLNAYKMGVEQTDRIQRVLIQTQNLGITTVGELGGNLAKVTPTAAAFGVSFEQIGSSLAIMTAQGTETANATTQLNALLSELGKSGQKGATNLEAAAKAAGLSSTSFTELMADGHSLAEILDMMAQYAEDNGLSLIDMFGSIEAGKGALSIGGDVNKFNSNLKAMETMADVVGEAYTKVTSTLESEQARLKTSFNNFKSHIGDLFLPVVKAGTSALAGLFEGLSGNKTAADSLKTAIDNLKTSSSEYLAVLAQLKTGEGEVTAEMVTRAKQANDEALRMLFDSFSKAKKKFEEKTKPDQEIADNMFGSFEADLKAFAENVGIGYTTVEDTYARLQRMYAEGKLAKGRGSWFKLDSEKDFEALANEMSEIMKAKAELDAQETEYEESRKLAVEALAEAYVDGNSAVSAYIAADKELYAEVMARAAHIPEERKAAEEKKKADEEAAAAAKAAADKEKEAADAANRRKNAISAAKEAMDKEISAADGLKAALGKNASESDYLSSKVSAYEKCIKSLLENGIDPQDEKLQKIVEDYKTAKTALEALNGETTTAAGVWKKYAQDIAVVNKQEQLGIVTHDEAARSLASIASGAISALMALDGFNAQDERFKALVETLKNLNSEINVTDITKLDKEMAQAKALFAATGDAEAYLSSRTSILKRRMQELIAQGLAPQSEAVQKVLAELKSAEKEAAEASNHWWRSYADDALAWGDFTSDAAKSVENAFKESFSAIGRYMVTFRKQVDDVEKSISKLETEQSELTDQLLASEADLAQAQSEGDLEAIENAQKQVDMLKAKDDALKAEISGLRDERDALKSGKSLWKELGKTALLALASVLEGLGAELAARAVANAIIMRWGSAAAAAAGSVAAFVAAGIAKGAANSMSTGGVVKPRSGVASTGDSTVIYANAGELILNRAQQMAIAEQLRILDRVADMTQGAPAGAGGGTIIVQFTGTVLGDQDSISEWVAEGIDRCRRQGKI